MFVVHSALLLYFGIMTYVVVAMLNQFRPMWWFILSFTVFLISQLVYFLLSKFICKVRILTLRSDIRIDVLRRAQIGKWTVRLSPPC